MLKETVEYVTVDTTVCWCLSVFEKILKTHSIEKEISVEPYYTPEWFYDELTSQLEFPETGTKECIVSAEGIMAVSGRTFNNPVVRITVKVVCSPKDEWNYLSEIDIKLSGHRAQ
jgi:hypothetical protein